MKKMKQSYIYVNNYRIIKSKKWWSKLTKSIKCILIIFILNLEYLYHTLWCCWCPSTYIYIIFMWNKIRIILKMNKCAVSWPQGDILYTLGCVDKIYILSFSHHMTNNLLYFGQDSLRMATPKSFAPMGWRLNTCFYYNFLFRIYKTTPYTSK